MLIGDVMFVVTAPSGEWVSPPRESESDAWYACSRAPLGPARARFQTMAQYIYDARQRGYRLRRVGILDEE